MKKAWRVSIRDRSDLIVHADICSVKPPTLFFFDRKECEPGVKLVAAVDTWDYVVEQQPEPSFCLPKKHDWVGRAGRALDVVCTRCGVIRNG